MEGLDLTKPTVRKLLDNAGDRITKCGKGTKTNPFRYAPYKMPTFQREAVTLVI
jgi:hypothetical protein